MDFYCPMHSDMRRPHAGRCPKCDMALVAQGTRFAFLRHMASRPLHVALMLAAMAALMAAVMLWLH